MKRLLAVTVVAVCLVLACAGAARAEPESWYTYWGVGWQGNSYPDGLESTLDGLKDAGFDSLGVSVDLLGFYWPVGSDSTLIAGVVLNGGGDRYYKGDDWLQVSTYLVGLSAMKFFGSEAGAGFFLRGDAGLAWYAVSDSEDNSGRSDMGYGGLVGAGYGIPVSAGTRILLNVNYALRHAEGEDIGSLGISVGGLF